MYIKIVQNLDDLRTVTSENTEWPMLIPQKIIMIECEYVEYRKLSVANIDEFNVYMKDNNICDYKIINEWKWTKYKLTLGDLVETTVKSEIRCEFILIRYLKDKYEYLVAPNCNMYLMGDNGKMIDSVRCK